MQTQRTAMLKTFSLLLLLVFLTFSMQAQNVSIEKSKVFELFHNHEYHEAIAYLEPAYSRDTVNIQMLSFLGYANYMNDDEEPETSSR
jgi:hypothetical protein